MMGTWCAAAPGELEVSAARGAHFHLLPTSPTRRRMRHSHRAIPRLLATHSLWQSEGLQRCRGKTTGYLQSVIALIMRDGHARLRSVDTVDHTAIVALLRQIRLDGTDHRHRIWIVSVIILVVVRIVIVVRIIPVQSKPETVVKDKEPIAEEMAMPPVPVVVPICIVTFDDTAHSSIERTTTESWSTRTESCSTAEVAPAEPCTSTSASGVSSTATTKTTTESSATAAVARCQSGVNQGHRCDAD